MVVLPTAFVRVHHIHLMNVEWCQMVTDLIGRHLLTNSTCTLLLLVHQAGAVSRIRCRIFVSRKSA